MLLAILALLALSSAHAGAAESRPFERGFSVSSGKPMSAAFDSDGNLYVLQAGTTPVIEKIDASGDPVPFTASQSYISGNKLTGTPTEPFYFETFIPSGVAVDRSGGPRDGDIYVPQGNGLHVYDETGTHRGMVPVPGPVCGSAVNQANGDLYASGYYSGEVQWYATDSGNPADYELKGVLKPVGTFDCQLGVNAAGDLYTSGYPFWGAAMRYPASQFGQPTATGTPFGTKSVSQFAIDPATNDVYASPGTQIEQYDTSGTLLSTIAKGDLVEAGGLARAADGRLYIFEANGQASVYGPAELDLPVVTTGAASAVAQNTATLAGEVDPDSAGDVEDCYFKYGTDQSYSSGTAPCVPAASPGTPITAPTSVTADLSGLAPDTLYYYRLFAENGNGIGAGHDGTFKTPLAIEGVTTGAATSVTKDSAVLGGSFVGDGQDVDYYFEYGTTTSYGQTQPTPPGADAGSAVGPQNVPPIEVDDLQGATTYHYRLVASNVYGSSYGADQTFTTAPAVTDLITDAPTAVTGETADLNGSFTADDYDTNYYFEYGQSASYGQTAPVPPGNNAGTGSGTLHVDPVTITGLQQGALYHFRIVATNSRGTTRGADRVFRTADAPAIRSFWSDDLTATSATLHATINPQDGDTSYRFEYGTTTDYGTVVPIPDGQIGGGIADKTVSIQLDDLIAGATYHFRVVATNQYGTTVSGDQTFNFFPAQCPNAQVRAETNSDHTPDCRAYEIASASYAGGTTLFPVGGPNTGLASNPARLAYGGGFGAIPGAGDPINTMGDLYVATRSDSGWTSKYIGLGATKTQQMGGPPEAGLTELLYQSPDRTQIGVQASPDMSLILSYDDGNPVFGATGPAKTGSNAPYIWDSSTNALVDRWPANLDQVENGADFVGTPKASADFTNFVFSSDIVFAEGGEEFEQPSGAPPAQPGDRGSRAWAGSVYDNDTVTGEVKLASVKSDGTAYPGIAVGISEDGSRIVITEGNEHLKGNPAPLRVRVDAELTYEIAGAHPVEFVSTTGDGKTVYFTSADPLTADDEDTSVDLFRWDEASPGSVTSVSFGKTGDAGNSDDCNVEWAEKCGIGIIDFRTYSTLRGGLGGNGVSDVFTASKSGDIYFQSPEQLDGARGEFGQVNLYVYRGGEVIFVATMEDEPLCTAVFGTSTCSDGPVARMQVTPDGSHAAFITTSQVTAYDNAGKGQMYTFEPENRRLVCVSCKANGEPPVSDVYGSQNGLFLTYDGRAFFSTRDSIVRQDTNNVIDVYEFTGGRPQLLTTGIGPGTGDKFTGFSGYLNHPGLVSVSADGIDAYFATLEQLVTQDHNGEQMKVYDARTNGGFPSDLPPPNCEAADECHGPANLPPAPVVDGTVANLGRSGNVTTKHKAKKKRKKARKRKHARRRNAGKRGKKNAKKRAQRRAKRSRNGSRRAKR